MSPERRANLEKKSEFPALGHRWSHVVTGEPKASNKHMPMYYWYRYLVSHQLTEVGNILLAEVEGHSLANPLCEGTHEDSTVGPILLPLDVQPRLSLVQSTQKRLSSFSEKPQSK